MAGYRYRGEGTRPTPPRRQYGVIPECGTPSGYARHRRLGEPKCDACREANIKDCRDRRAAAKNKPEFTDATDDTPVSSRVLRPSEIELVVQGQTKTARQLLPTTVIRA